MSQQYPGQQGPMHQPPATKQMGAGKIVAIVLGSVGLMFVLMIGGCAALIGGVASTTTTTQTDPGNGLQPPSAAPTEEPTREPSVEPSKPAAKPVPAPKPVEKPAPAPKAKVVKVSAAKLIKDFEDNELRADATYKGRTLQVTGVVEEVDTELFDSKKYILRINDGDEWAFLSVSAYDIPANELSKLDVDDKVTVIGEFSDGGDLGVTINNAHVKG